MTNPPAPGMVRVSLDVPRDLLLQLRDQLWPHPDPTLEADLAEISAKYLRRLPPDALAKLITA
jgi:hypothetical protein